MTYREIRRILIDSKIENAEWDAALLIEHFCRVDAGLARLDHDRDYPSPALTAAVLRRASRYPLQYLIGEWQFYRQTYEVSPDCLIPRSDTEILVEEAIKRLPNGAHFADLCTGSGCIAISVLAERPDTTATAVEKFSDTLAVAERNAQRNGVQARFDGILADVLTDEWTSDGVCFDAILSNPPYIPENDLQALAPELHAEPRAALDGGEDGLVFYRAILRRATRWLKPDGFILFEIGYDQAEAVTALGTAAGLAESRVLRDLGGNDRVVFLQKRVTDHPMTE